MAGVIMAMNNGYIRVYMPEHINADENGLIYEHQLMAEKKIGRALKDTEVVHHIDQNRSNNSIDNLLIFASNSDHIAFHHNNIYTLDEEGIAHCEGKSKNVNICLLCGQNILWSSKYCEQCGHIIQRKVMDRPNREQLKRLIRLNSFTQIGLLYDVSDNTIRKWCKSENLPYKSSVIKDISDEEWQKI